MSENNEDDTNEQEVERELKRIVNELKQYEGRGTQLVSVYIPPEKQISDVVAHISSEYGEAQNIKRKNTRKNVQSALSSIKSRLKYYDTVPENGMAVFSGVVDENTGQQETFVVDELPIEISSYRYHCDDEFLVEPLEAALNTGEVYGLVVLDRRTAQIGKLVGDRIVQLDTLRSNIMGKHRAGGQCLTKDTLVEKPSGDINELQDISVGETIVGYENGEQTESKVENKWVTEKETYRVTTKHPNADIELSGDHTVFYLSGSGIEQKPASELAEGDEMLLAYNRRGGVDENKTQRLPIYELSNNLYVGQEGRDKIRELRKDAGLSQSQLGERVDEHQASVSRFERTDENNIDPERVQKYCDAVGIDTNAFYQKYCEPVSWSPPEHLTEEIAQILGYHMADGSYDDSRIRFAEDRKEVAEYYRGLSSEVFGTTCTIHDRTESKGYYCVRVYGRPVSELMRHLGSVDSFESDIPAEILSDTGLLKAFIRGFFDGEASVSGEIQVSGVNEKLLSKTQIGLNQLGIITAKSDKSVEMNELSSTPQYSVRISDKESLQKFNEEIGLTSTEKTDKLDSLCKQKSYKSKSNQVAVGSKEVKDVVGYSSDFSSSYLEDRRGKSRMNFRNKTDNPELIQMSQRQLTPTTVTNVQKTGVSKELIDIETSTGNFLADGLLVHNSAKRFDRLIEEALNNFFKEIAERVNSEFVEDRHDINGIIVGGPSPTKDEFLDTDGLHHELDVIGVFDIDDTTERGFNQLVQRAHDVIEENQLVEQRQLMERFLKQLRTDDGQVSYGADEVLYALNIGAVDTLLVSESRAVDDAYVRECENGHEEIEISEKSLENCSTCGSELETVETKTLAKFVESLAQDRGTEVVYISDSFEEGEQLKSVFGGLASLLRFNPK